MDIKTSYRAGYSFLAEPESNLYMSFKHLNRRAFSLQKRRLALQVAGSQQAMAYLQRGDDLLDLCRNSIDERHARYSGRPSHYTLGKYCRCTPQCDNTQGSHYAAFAYNKVTTTANNSFYIIRLRCPTIEWALFLYSANIKPFTDFVLRQSKLINA
jgi:hypothetical protein